MKKLQTILLTLLSLLPASAFAACTTGSDNVTLCTLGSGAGANKVAELVNKVTGWVLGFGASIAVLFVIFGGFQYITAAGNEKQAETAKQTLTWAILGLVVMLLAYVIVKLITNATNSVL